MYRVGDPIHDRPQQAGEKSPVIERRFDFDLGVGTVPELGEGMVDPDHRDHVDDRDQIQKQPRGQGSGEAEHVTRWRLVVSQCADSACTDHDQHSHHQHQARMPHGEPEADRLGPLAVGHQLARGVVDGGDVVRVEGMPQPEEIRGGAQTHTEYLGAGAIVMRRNDEYQYRESDHMHERDHAEQGTDLGEVATLPGREQATDKRGHATAFQRWFPSSAKTSLAICNSQPVWAGPWPRGQFSWKLTTHGCPVLSMAYQLNVKSPGNPPAFAAT